MCRYLGDEVGIVFVLYYVESLNEIIKLFYCIFVYIILGIFLFNF